MTQNVYEVAFKRLMMRYAYAECDFTLFRTEVAAQMRHELQKAKNEKTARTRRKTRARERRERQRALGIK